MLQKKGIEKEDRMRTMKKIGVLVVAAAIVTLVVAGVGAQEKSTVSLSEGETINLNVNQMELPKLLRLIAEQANLNIVISKEVAGPVSVRLKNVNLWEALTAILEVSGFGYRVDKGIVRVVKLGEVVEERRVLVTEVVGLKYAKAEDMKKASQHLLSSSGTMETDLRSNALVITDSAESIERIRQLVAKLDTGVPVFNLMGILSSAESSLVMINDSILKLGDTIGEYTVSEIAEDSVFLKKGEETIILTLREELRATEK